MIRLTKYYILVVVLFVLMIFSFYVIYSNLNTRKIISGVTVTAYCPGRCCNGKWVGKLAIGDDMKKWSGKYNIVAVDPHVIPLWSIVYYKNVFYLALDVGGKIKGKHIDILMRTHKEALRFGVRRNQVIEVGLCLKR